VKKVRAKHKEKEAAKASMEKASREERLKAAVIAGARRAGLSFKEGELPPTKGAEVYRALIAGKSVMMHEPHETQWRFLPSFDYFSYTFLGICRLPEGSAAASGPGSSSKKASPPHRHQVLPSRVLGHSSHLFHR
jgi:hypothetical protein